MMRWLRRLVLMGVVLFAALQAYVRFSPNDPALWHVEVAAAGFAPAANWAAYCPAAGSRFAVSGLDPATFLAELDRIALATPRTRRLAGSPEAGRITWITRSALMGYPDFTTATTRAFAGGAQPCIVARARFGDYDWGVNGARLSGWVQDALDLAEPPPRIWN